MSKELDSILLKIEGTREQWNQLYQRLISVAGSDGRGLDTERDLPGITLTIGQVRVRILRAFDLLIGLRSAIAGVVLPAAMVNDLGTSVDQFSASVQELSTHLSNIEANGGIASINPENFVITSGNAASSANFGKLIRNTSIQLDAVFTNFYRVLPAFSPQAVAAPTAVISEAVRLLKSAEGFAAEVHRLKEMAAEEQSTVARHRTEAEAMRNEVERLRGESEQSRKSVGEYEADATQKMAQMKGAVAESERLAALARNFQPEFERFQAEMTQREGWFAKAKQNEDELISRLTEKDAEIERINGSAEAMLKGATVAGLASSFGDIRDKITRELNWARYGFYFAVGLLFMSVLPLIVYIIPGLSLFGLLRGSSMVGDFELGQILIRALLLVPSAWLAKFAAARHATLFRLREHYAYKYSIAASVEGFKKQAPSLQDEIAAAAFRELTFNPADRMDHKSPESEHPNPVVDWIMRKLGATHDGEKS